MVARMVTREKVNPTIALKLYPVIKPDAVTKMVADAFPKKPKNEKVA